MTEHDEALRLAAAHLAGGLSPPYRTDTTAKIATALLAYHAECERLRKGLEEMRSNWARYDRRIEADIDALIGKAGE